ncbi:hypothetical protein LguiB_003114 [Lonicera macranthoides]
MDEVENYYGSKPDGENEAAEASNCGDTTATEGNEEVGGVAATAAALKGAAEAGKLVDTSGPVDQGTELNALHNFILPISLSALKEFGGPHGVRAAFMVRKQRLEATVGLMARLVQDLNHSGNAIFHSEMIPAFGSSFKSGINDSRNKPFPPSSSI